MALDSAYPCPVCHTLTTLEHPCPGCNRAPDPDAAAVITLDGRIADLKTQVAEAKRRFDDLSAQLLALHREREQHASVVRASVAASQEGLTVRFSPPAPIEAPALPPAPVKQEASGRTVQTLLFILGGVILGIAAIVFTGVAFTKLGVGGRAAILGTVTLLTLAVPPLARRRALTGTAETAAALGFLLVLLDGYAAWFVDLFGVKRWDPSFYAAIVLALTAALASAYGWGFRLAGPRIAALLCAQPVLPLAFATSGAPAEVWAMLLAAMAAGNAAFLWLRPKPLGLRILGWIAHGTALAAGFGVSAILLGTKHSVLASLAVMTVALAVAAGAWVAGAFTHRAIAGAVVALALGSGLARPLLPFFDGQRKLAVAAAVCAGVAVLAWSLSPRPRTVAAPPAVPPQPAEERIPALWSTFDPAKEQAPPPPPETPREPWTLGGRWGAAAGLAIPAVIATAWAIWLGFRAVLDAFPWWHAAAVTTVWRWELPLTAVLVTGTAVLLLLRRPAQRDLVTVAGAVIFAFTLPGAASIVDLAVAAGLIAWVLTAPSRAAVKTLAAVLLMGHALASGQGEPTRAMLVMAAVVAMGFSVGTAAPRRGLRRTGALFAAITDLVFPWLAFTAVAAFGGSSVASWRLLLAFVILLPVLGSPRGYRAYLLVAGLVTTLYPLWPALPEGESQAIYAAGAAIASALVVRKYPWAWARWAATLPILVILIWTAPDWSRALPWVTPGRIWSGAAATPEVDTLNAVALTLLLCPIVLLCWRLGRRTALSIGGFAAVLPALMWLAVAQAPWPALPAVTLLFGLSTVVVSVLRRMSPALTAIGALLVLSGLSGAALEKWTTIVALSLTIVALAAIAVAAASTAARIIAWFTGAVAKVLLAITIGETAGLAPELTAYLVLIVAGLLLGLAYSPIARGPGSAPGASGLGAAPVGTGPGSGSASWPSGSGLGSASAASSGGSWPVGSGSASWPVGSGLGSAPAASSGGSWPSGSGPGSAPSGSGQDSGLASPTAAGGLRPAIEASAHAAALVALALTAGSARAAAGVFALWGVAIGLTALSNRPVLRATLAGAAEAIAWILVLRSYDVGTLEAYTLPVALVAAVVGVVCARQLTSWLAYGPALGAALLPSLGAVLISDGQLWRRLLLGVGALAIVVAGAALRKQAPFILGGSTLVILGLYEIVQISKRVQTWIPLTLVGLIIVGLAITYERRRRDLATLRTAITRMT